MKKKITVELTEDELDSIILCLDARAHESDAAKKWKIEYKRLADELQKKLN